MHEVSKNASPQGTADSSASCCCNCNVPLMFGSLLLRLWLAIRALQTGIEKFAGTTMAGAAVKVDGAPNQYGLTASASVKEYALSHYHGVPKALMDKFSAEPLLPAFALKIYDVVLGPALLVLGLTTLLGLAYRTSLFLQGLLYISLTFGLILIKEDSGVAWLGIHMIMIVMALMISEHNRYSVMNFSVKDCPILNFAKRFSWKEFVTKW